MLFSLRYRDPLSIFHNLKEYGHPVIFERRVVESGKSATLVAADPDMLIETGRGGTFINGEFYSSEKNPFKAAAEIHREFGGYLFGYVPYGLFSQNRTRYTTASSCFGHYTGAFFFNKRDGKTYFNGYAQNFEPERVVRRETENWETEPEYSTIDQDATMDDYREMVTDAKDHIMNGNVYQLVLSRQYKITGDFDGLSVLKRLRNYGSGKYNFLMDLKDTIVGSSPERLATVESGLLTVNPIAGTRGKDDLHNMRSSLLDDQKEVSEHIMLVDLARNDVRMVSKPGSVMLRRMMEAVNYGYVTHLESEVTGKLLDGFDSFDALEAVFPAGTLTGAPKIRAMELINRMEKTRRRVYGGATGIITPDGNADFAINIRMVELNNRTARVRAGAGIVADSVPENEFFETEAKMYPVLRALGVRK